MNLENGLSSLFPLALFVMIFWKNKSNATLKNVQSSRKNDETEILNQHFELIFQKANDILLVWDNSGKIIEANKKATEAYGYSHEELIGLNIRDIRTPLAAEQIEKQLHLAEQEDGLVIETFHQKKDGTVIPVEVSLGVINLSDNKFYHSIVRDISERKVSEETIKRSENHYRVLAGNIPETNLFLFDKDLRFLIADGTEMQRLGLKREDFEGKTLYEILDDETRSFLIPLYQSALNGEIVFREFVYGYFYYTIQIRPLIDSTGAVYGGLTITQNVTERKLAEKQILENQQRYAAIISSAMDAIITVDEEQRITLFNNTAEKIFGFTQSEVIGKSLEILIPPQYRHEHFHHINKFGNTGVTNRTMGSLGKIYGLKSNGEVFPIEASISQVNVSDKKYFTVILRDITQRLKTEEAIKESENRYKFLFENNPLPMWVFSEDTFKFLNVNKSAIESYGYSFEEFMSMTIKDIRPDDDFDRLLKYVRHDKERPRFAGIWKHKRKDGSIIFVEVYSHPLEYIGHKARLVLANDITEQKLNEDKIHQLNLELESRVEERTLQLQNVNKELESFSYSVSHDLRSPLRSLDGFSQALYEDYFKILDDTGKDYLTRIRNASQRMAHLIDDLLNLSKVSRQELLKKEVNLSEMFEKIAKEIETEYLGKTFTVKIEPGLFVEADQQLLTVAVTNLMSNAFKYSSKKEKPEIELISIKSDDELVFCLKDNGAGFDMNYANKLFGAFQRFHSVNEFPGTGVGLATTQRIISKHGGRIWAESELKIGTKFYFTL